MTPPYKVRCNAARRVGVAYAGGAIRDDVGIVPYGHVRIDGEDCHGGGAASQ